jgi:hypothetical protein
MTKRTVRTLQILLLAGCALTFQARADTLYKCLTSDGRTTYTNQKTSKDCEIISQDKPVSTFAAPPAQKQIGRAHV